ncbi:divergent polysaccharide deacetylase family protein [Sulfurimonas marina]|uniref:Divergent polysaccharide deacetylase family protein n=1 Tax=Sulfurimonas marina TaxID=2590551 RepID=A0A7M1AWK6_9BACT|nr:divergent polysaccharide deacetylase family protein [Sulfurimonas marina]QOP41851.1 divergent polysaccharide deacetylase family protein [Sulfurimonas marina]
MARKRKKKTSNSSKALTYVAWFLAIVALMLSSMVAGYYFGFNEGKEEINTLVKKEQKKQKELLKKLEKTAKIEKQDVTKRLQEVLKKESKSYTSASHEIEDTTLVNPPKKTPEKRVVTTNKPELTIIIDDVSTASQVRAIKSLKIPLTMSFLPPSSARPNSAKLAEKESGYMVHLPMEAQHFSKEEPYTLRVHDSQQEIYKRVQDIKHLFPKVEYINNHTGSKFTSNEVAMNRLFFAFQKLNLHFVDSRTTAETQAPKVSKNYGVRYVARDVFLDHHMEKEYVKEQIKKAVKFAKTHGKAIAIGHPHKNTLQALAESKALLQSVHLVKIGEIY